ncbi:hypothetical protein [Nakamurella lactea]|uniref:hypothetical protein n=1 Tax=Nakamurella lactea TaxID=459515 RepID=UPI0003FAF861|nr:hypothetical protein [Nakamurella lactea]
MMSIDPSDVHQRVDAEVTAIEYAVWLPGFGQVVRGVDESRAREVVDAHRAEGRYCTVTFRKRRTQWTAWSDSYNPSEIAWTTWTGDPE